MMKVKNQLALEKSDKKRPLHLAVKRQSGNRAIGVSPTTFPHKLTVLLKLPFVPASDPRWLAVLH